jgi:uncharacterized protein (DUF1330 family)
MPAYAIGRLRAENWSWLKEYGPVVAELIEKHGGRYLARGGEMQRLEGEEELPDAYVVLEFPSIEQARSWYDDPAYAPMIELRKPHCAVEFHLVEGVE